MTVYIAEEDLDPAVVVEALARSAKAAKANRLGEKAQLKAQLRLWEHGLSSEVVHNKAHDLTSGRINLQVKASDQVNDHGAYYFTAGRSLTVAERVERLKQLKRLELLDVSASKNATKKPYTAADIDFVVAFIDQLDLFYLLPQAVVGDRMGLWIRPDDTDGPYAQYAQYKENWGLIVEAYEKIHGTSYREDNRWMDLSLSMPAEQPLLSSKNPGTLFLFPDSEPQRVASM